MSSLSESEAREFHSAYITGFIGFTIIAITAHALLYMWKPWFQRSAFFTERVDFIHVETIDGDKVCTDYG